MLNKKKASKKLINPHEEIKRLAYTQGVLILLDWDESTDTSRSGGLYAYEPKKKVLEINVCGLKIIDKTLLLDIIRKVHEDGGFLWKASKQEALDSYAKYSSTNKYKDTLALYSKILTKSDFEALKMSFYLRELDSKGKPIYTYKMDIFEKFGERGANISNLCSSGYFENEFKLFYETDTVPDFMRYYELAVGEKARALFVHSRMSVENIDTEVNIMVEKALKYHMEDFRIHGKGKVNVQNIKEFASLRTDDDDYIMRLVYDDPKLAIEYIVEIKRK